MAEIHQTDVSRPSALPTANLVLQRAPSAHHPTDQTSLDYLNGVEKEWNDRVDADIEVLVEGMVELVNLASVCIHTPH
jgi:mediator of RNA polymerase II transcription subunit 22